MTAVKSAYHSPLRAAQAEATRRRIVEACVALVEAGEELTFAAVAGAAQVQERTVYRHFARKADLEAAVWSWITGNLTHADLEAKNPDQLVEAMRRSFRGFHEGGALIRAMLHSPQGLQVRRAQQTERAAMFRATVAAAAPGLPAADRDRAAAVLQILYSATAWEQLCDLAGLDSRGAADAVELGIRAFLAGLPAAINRRQS
jgi:AcrR family transcriptional regulator